MNLLLHTTNVFHVLILKSSFIVISTAVIVSSTFFIANETVELHRKSLMLNPVLSIRTSVFNFMKSLCDYGPVSKATYVFSLKTSYMTGVTGSQISDRFSLNSENSYRW